MFNLKRFAALAKMRTDQLVGHLSNELRRKYHYTNIKVRKDNYIYAEGTIPIAVIAHLDTAFTKQPLTIYHDKKKKVLLSPDYGLGADDRAGVEAILEILDKGLRPTVIFTLGEEVGGIGATQLIKDITPKFNFLIELDRSGVDDCVFYQCGNPEFVSYIESFGFEEQSGSFTDISFLAPAWGCAATNLSIGYFNEHSHSEYLNYNILEATVAKTIRILSDSNSSAFAYIEKTSTCDLCDKTHPYLIPCTFAGAHGVSVHLCPQCYIDYKEYIVHDN